MTQVRLKPVKGNRNIVIRFRDNIGRGKSVGVAELPNGKPVKIIRGKILRKAERPIIFRGKTYPITQDRGFYDPNRRLIVIGNNASKSTLAHELGHAVDHLHHPRQILNAYRSSRPSRRQFLTIENGAEKQRKRLRIFGRLYHPPGCMCPFHGGHR